LDPDGHAVRFFLNFAVDAVRLFNKIGFIRLSGIIFYIYIELCHRQTPPRLKRGGVFYLEGRETGNGRASGDRQLRFLYAQSGADVYVL
jgi:hypothetical protein